MDNKLQQDLITMKNILQQEVSPCVVQMRQLATKRLDTLVRFDIIDPNNPFGAESFDVFRCRKGRMYWNRSVDMNEDMNQKVVN